MLFALLLLLAADPTGTYELQGVREMASALELAKGGTFRYALAYGAADYSAEGTWKLDGDAVVLNSKVTDAVPVKIVRSSAGTSDAIRIVLKSTQGRPIPNIGVYLNETRQQTDSDGAVMFPPSKSDRVVRIEVRVYQFESTPFPLKSGDNEVEFALNGEALTQVPFKNERLKITGDVLELRFWDPDKAMRYKKQ